MTYIRPSTDTVLEYDDATKRSIYYDRNQAEIRLTEIAAELAEIPLEPDDAKLLAWAKKNYPAMDYSAKRDSLLAQQDKLTAVLAVKELKAQVAPK
jgi:hypothetical protein